jgi:trk system potassium uptake protein TrkH
MFDLRPVFLVSGALLSLLALAMCLPALADLAHGNDDWLVFAASAAVTLFVGQALVAANRTAAPTDVSARQTFLFTVVGWLVVCLAAALPFAFSGLHLTPTDALFEAISGVTTTGATVLRGLDRAPPGILLWRALLQWLGGMGFLVMAVIVLPTLKIGGMEVFRLETSTAGERVMLRAAKVGAGIVAIYVALTLLLVVLLWLAGMSRFPALVHAMSTISCGGFSTADGSIGSWRNAAVDWVILLGMLTAGAPFVIYLQIAGGQWKAAVRNSQLRWYLTIIVAAGCLIAVWLMLFTPVKPLPALRHALFTVVSVMTGTGFATLDWAQWSDLPVAILFFLTLLGGCAGSTAGGFKVFRLQILYIVGRAQIGRLVEPHGVFLPQYERKPVTDLVAESVLSFLFVYMLSFGILAMALGLVGLDFTSAISAAASALANLGPGLSHAVGPMSGYHVVPDAAKWLLSAGMLFGRLEMFLVLALFTRDFWK